MKNQKETIRKFVNQLNEEGGFWLPNIQRLFVWNKDQIEKLYDSILREYPIGSLLIWKTQASIKTRRFINNYTIGTKYSDYNQAPNSNKKLLVLDGQQRLQSLFIGLKGSYNKGELYIDILSGDVNTPQEIKYIFKFLIPSQVKFPMVKFKEIVLSDEKNRDIKKKIIHGEILNDEKLDRIEENIEIIRNVFCIQENIIYQEIDSIDRPNAYSEDDIVEIFIRANSGGTLLGKSDLLFSLLTVSWDEAGENIEDLLDSLNKTGYDFNRDFILKTCLTLFNKGASYKVDKFREDKIRQDIFSQWDRISDAIKDVKDFIYNHTFLKTDKAVPSYLSLIPLIYFRFHYNNLWEEHKKDYQNYLIRTSLAGVFGGNPDSLIDRTINRINLSKSFDLKGIYQVMRSAGRNLEISKDEILNLHYGSKEIHLIFNIWYGYNYNPSFEGNKPQIDHIFPQSKLQSIKEINPKTGRKDLMKYKKIDRNQISNLMLLSARENGIGGKSDTLPSKWFKDKSTEYLDLHLIPHDKKLWEIEQYEDFINVRKMLIIDKFKEFLF